MKKHSIRLFSEPSHRKEERVGEMMGAVGYLFGRNTELSDQLLSEFNV